MERILSKLGLHFLPIKILAPFLWVALEMDVTSYLVQVPNEGQQEGGDTR